MTLPLTPDTLRAAYDYICTTPPFSRWNMPEGEEIVFRVVRDPGLRGWYNRDGRGRHVIAISSRCIGHTNNLIATVAHEALHLHQRDTRMETPCAQHNAAFNKLAERVCRYHGWDPRLF